MSYKSCQSYLDNCKTCLENASLDSVKSGESQIKHYTFNNSHTDKDFEKCVQFWKSMKSKSLQPVKGTQFTTTESSLQTEEAPEFIWCNALDTLQKCGLDKAIGSFPACNFCNVKSVKCELKTAETNEDNRINSKELPKCIKSQQDSSLSVILEPESDNFVECPACNRSCICDKIRNLETVSDVSAPLTLDNVSFVDRMKQEDIIEES